jgi:hypothetical protein
VDAIVLRVVNVSVWSGSVMNFSLALLYILASPFISDINEAMIEVFCLIA